MAPGRAGIGLILLLAGLLGTGCGGSSGPPATTAAHGHPDLEAFLRLPVASPRTCPASVNGTTAGRRSPWVGTVDVSVFLRPKASASTIAALRTTIARLPDVQTVYVETAAQAHAEFERLYTCSAGVPAAAVPPSLRLVLSRIDLTRRDTLVTRLLRLHGVVTVSCDPSSPCVDAVRRASSPASPGATSSR